MKKVLLYFPGYNKTIGGSENRFLAFCAWLQDRCDLTVAMRIVPDFAFLSQQYGIIVDGKRVKHKILKLQGWRKLVGRIFACEEELALKELAREYDICISCHGPRDFGKPAYHFIHMIWSFDEDIAAEYGKIQIQEGSLIRKVVKHIRNVIRNIIYFLPSLPKNVMCDIRQTCIPNSEYVKHVLEKHYGVSLAPTFYPPTFFEPKAIARKDGLKVGYVGRIHEEKFIHLMIDVVRKVRESTGKDLQIYLAGYLDDSDYCSQLLAKSDDMPWVHFVGEVRGISKDEFLADKSFALHFLKGEAFGISITEYIKSGVIPIVPRGSAPDEIVADADLIFDSIEEATEILSHLVSSPEFVNGKRKELTHRADYFRKERYLDRQNALLSTILHDESIKESEK